MLFTGVLRKTMTTESKRGGLSPSTRAVHKSNRDTIQFETVTGPPQFFTEYRNVLGAPQAFDIWGTRLTTFKAVC